MEVTDELKIASDNAWSIKEKDPPIGLKLIGIERKKNREYLFYKDIAGNYWYRSRTRTIKN